MHLYVIQEFKQSCEFQSFLSRIVVHFERHITDNEKLKSLCKKCANNTNLQLDKKRFDF